MRVRIETEYIEMPIPRDANIFAAGYRRDIRPGMRHFYIDDEEVPEEEFHRRIRTAELEALRGEA